MSKKIASKAAAATNIMDKQVSAPAPKFSFDPAGLADAITNHMIKHMRDQLDDLLIMFSRELVDLANSKAVDISPELIDGVIADTLPDQKARLTQTLVKEKKKSELEAKKLSDPNTHFCVYELGARSKTPGKCNKTAKNQKDDEYYCTPHFNTINNQHFCEFKMSSRSNKAVCEVRVKTTDKSGQLSHDDHEYNGSWLCTKHTKQVRDQIKKAELPQCAYTKSDKKNKNEVRCKNKCKDASASFCVKHLEDDSAAAAATTTSPASSPKPVSDKRKKAADEEETDDMIQSPKPASDKKKKAAITKEAPKPASDKKKVAETSKPVSDKRKKAADEEETDDLVPADDEPLISISPNTKTNDEMPSLEETPSQPNDESEKEAEEDNEEELEEE